MIEFYLQTEEALIFNNLKNVLYTELVEDEKIRQFAENLYFLLQMILRNKNQIKIDNHKQIVLEFLKNNDVLDKKLCIQLLHKLERI